MSNAQTKAYFHKELISSPRRCFPYHAMKCPFPPENRQQHAMQIQLSRGIKACRNIIEHAGIFPKPQKKPENALSPTEGVIV